MSLCTCHRLFCVQTGIGLWMAWRITPLVSLKILSLGLKISAHRGYIQELDLHFSFNFYKKTVSKSIIMNISDAFLSPS